MTRGAGDQMNCGPGTSISSCCFSWPRVWLPNTKRSLPGLRRPKTKSSGAFALLASGWAARAPGHQHPAHNYSTEKGQKELVQGSELLSGVTEGGDVVGESSLASGAHS